MRMFLVLVLLSSVIGCFSVCCSGKKNSDRSIEERPVDSTLISEQKQTQLIETILNLPRVIKLSKFEVIKKARPTIYILLPENLYPGSVPVITQNKYPLTVLHNLVSLDTSTQPCYVFSRIEIEENTATVQMFYDITGMWANGKLTFVDGKWIPDENFRVTVR